MDLKQEGDRHPNLRISKTMKTTTIRHTIGTNIKHLMTRTLDVITETELSARSHLHLSTVQNILQGSVDVDVDMIAAIANALGVDASALLADPGLPVDPLAMYRSRIAALPADQQQRIQAFLDSVPMAHEETAIH